MNSGFVLASLCLWQYFREGSRAPVRFQNSALASDLGLWFAISRHSLDSLETYPDLRQLPSQGVGWILFPQLLPGLLPPAECAVWKDNAALCFTPGESLAASAIHRSGSPLIFGVFIISGGTWNLPYTFGC